MVSRTIMKQQMMRQMVMEEEKPHREMARESNENRNSYKGNWNIVSQSNENLPTFTTDIIPPEKNFGYYKQYLDDSNRMNFKTDPNTINKDDFSFICSDYYDDTDKNNSSYLLTNMCHQNGVVQSFNIDRNVDANGYNVQYGNNLSDKPSQMVHHQDRYIQEMPLPCPMTPDKTTGNVRRMSTATRGATNDKGTKTKDRSKKESHNRIERKRRDFINKQIIELSHLLPSQMMSEGESKKNKGNILKNSVTYIQHLQNESMHSANYVKETDLAFMLVDSYRNQIQELQEQLRSVSLDVSTMPVNNSVSHVYHNYLIIREHNRTVQKSNHDIAVQSNNSVSSDGHTKHLSLNLNKSPLSPSDNGSAFKVEPRSVQSSVGTNSLSSMHRMDEDASVRSSSLTPEISQQINQSISMT